MILSIMWDGNVVNEMKTLNFCSNIPIEKKKVLQHYFVKSRGKTRAVSDVHNIKFILHLVKTSIIIIFIIFYGAL